MVLHAEEVTIGRGGLNYVIEGLLFYLAEVLLALVLRPSLRMQGRGREAGRAARVLGAGRPESWGTGVRVRRLMS